MGRILDCPNEVLAMICSYLNPFELENVAKTFNHGLYNVSRPLLEHDKWWIDNARRMTALFPPLHESKRRLKPSFPGHLPRFSSHTDLDPRLADGSLELPGKSRATGPYIRSSPPDLRSWMNLCGSMDWLLPLEPKLAAAMEPHNGPEGAQPVASSAQIDAMVKHSKELGLILPVGFEKFLRSKNLHVRLPSTTAWFFRLSKIIKAPPKLDNGAGGYVVRFHCDQQGCAFSYLYFNTRGNHCVIMSSTDPYGYGDNDQYILDEMLLEDEGVGDTSKHQRYVEKDDEHDQGEEDDHEYQRHDFRLVGLSFEEYLIQTYYEELIKFHAKPFPGLLAYVDHVFQPRSQVK